MTSYVEVSNPVISEFVARWPSVEAFTQDAGVRSRTHVGTMIVRGSIPVRYWRALIEGAERRCIRGITADHLQQGREATMAKTVRTAVRRRPAHTRASTEKKPTEFVIFDCARLRGTDRIGVVLGVAHYFRGEPDYRVRFRSPGHERHTDDWVAGSKLELA